jgi:hypothetical protein
MNLGLKKVLIGALLGLGAGIIDLIPMLINQLSMDAIFSALSMWIVVGIFTSTIDLKINAVVKGIFVSLLTLLPCAFLIFHKSYTQLLPIISMTLILGGLLGFVIGKFNNKQNQAIRSGRIYREKRK